MLVIIGLALVCYALYYILSIMNAPAALPETPFPLLWNLPQMLLSIWRGRLLARIVRLTTSNSSLTMCVGLPGRPWVVSTANAENVTFMLTSAFDKLSKPPKFKSVFRPLLGDSIFNVDGHVWESQRKLASHLFKKRNVRLMRDVFHEHLSSLHASLDEACSSGEPIDVQRLLGGYTFSTIVQIAFGMSVTDTDEFQMHFDRAQKLMFYHYLNPLAGTIDALGLQNASLLESVAYVRNFCSNVIKERRANPLPEGGDVLSRYLSMSGDPQRGIEHFSDEYLVDVIMSFLLAGRDTTQATLTWLLYEMAVNKSVEAKLAKALEGVEPTLENCDEGVPYLKGVVREGLRLHPPVPVDPKFTLERITLPTGHVLAKGTIVSWNAISMGRTDVYWDAPMEFRPERWTEGASANGGKDVPNVNGGTWVPFQLGRRVCLGMQMATVEVSLVLMSLVQRYSFELAPGFAPVEQVTITYSSRNGMLLKVAPKTHL